jgi:ribosomal protein S3AE
VINVAGREAMGRRVRGTVDPRKRKSRYVVKCPNYLANGALLYEIPASDPELLIDRIVEIPLGSLKRSMEELDLNTNVLLQVKSVSGNTAFTEFKGFYVTQETIRAKVHRGISKIEAIITLNTADGVKVRINTIVITAHRCRTKVKEDIRKAVFKYRSERVPKMSFEEFVNFVISDLPKEEIHAIVHKIFPTSEVFVAKVKVLSDPTERKLEAKASE